jgi:hypothetical protein
MNQLPNLPEDIGFGKLAPTSWRGSLTRAGAAWMFTAYLTDVPGGILLRHHPDWPVLLRLFIVLVPLIATALYVRGLAGWIRGLDELHRRVVLTSWLFATTVYLLLAITWLFLDRAGIFAALNLVRFHLDQMPFSNSSLAISLTFLLASAGYAHFSRRYQ